MLKDEGRIRVLKRLEVSLTRPTGGLRGFFVRFRGVVRLMEACRGEFCTVRRAARQDFMSLKPKGGSDGSATADGEAA